MGFFGKILEKLGIGHDDEAKPGAGTAAGTAPASESTVTASAATAAPASEPAAASPSPPRAVPLVDVEAQMDFRAKENAQKLNWRTSIVDLLKLLDIDSSLPARKELAAELGCPASLMGDSAKMNIWLHKAVLTRIAANGGTVPADLLD